MSTQLDVEPFLQLALATDDDSLRLIELRGREAMSTLFRFDLTFATTHRALAAAEVVGKPAAFTLQLSDGTLRPFHGCVSRLVGGDETEDYRLYRLEVVPWLWYLQHASDCRIFQRVTVPQILEQVFRDRGFSDFELVLEGDHPQHEYCVQYRETDFDFVTRIMSQEGIFYYFRHEAGRHVLVVGDTANAYLPRTGGPIDFPHDHGSRERRDHIKSWEHGYDLHCGRWSHTDFDFEKPDSNLSNSTRSVVQLAGTDRLERYDFPGQYIDREHGRQLADLRMAAYEAAHDQARGSSTCRGLAIGTPFEIGSHRSSDEQGRAYVVTALEHQARAPLPYSSGDGSAMDYSNQFTCIPDRVVSRPIRHTAPPLIHGVQTAIVVGPDGEEIYTDQHGRVKVQFHWDRIGQRNADSSCWVRVSQGHAGKGFGAIDIPRIGEEVIVSFLEGDPNRPIVTGRVYHAKNPPPYTLPGKKVISGIKSKTYKGDGYNECILDDTPGDELIRFHAQRDMQTTVLHDTRETIGRDETVTIDRDRTETIKRRHCQKIYGEKDVWIGAGYNTQVLAEMNEFVVISRSEETLGFKTEYVGAYSFLEVRRHKTERIGKNSTLEVGGNARETVKGNKESTIKQNLKETIDGDHEEVVRHRCQLRAESYQVQAETIELIATRKITFKVGDTVLTLDPQLLSGNSEKTEWLGGLIQIDSRGDLNMLATDKLDMNSLEFSLHAGSEGEIKASVVKINC